MNCPNCDHPKHRVLWTRRDTVESKIRALECFKCEHLWHTLEVEIPRHAFKYIRKAAGETSTPDRMPGFRAVTFS